jgi:hypothetical protein
MVLVSVSGLHGRFRGVTLVDYEEVLLLVFCYVTYSGQQKTCDRVLKVSNCLLAIDLIADDSKEVPVLEQLRG